MSIRFLYDKDIDPKMGFFPYKKYDKELRSNCYLKADMKTVTDFGLKYITNTSTAFSLIFQKYLYSMGFSYVEYDENHVTLKGSPQTLVNKGFGDHHQEEVLYQFSANEIENVEFRLYQMYISNPKCTLKEVMYGYYDYLHANHGFVRHGKSMDEVVRDTLIELGYPCKLYPFSGILARSVIVGNGWKIYRTNKILPGTAWVSEVWRATGNITSLFPDRYSPFGVFFDRLLQ